MSESTDPGLREEGERLPLKRFTERAYLDYAMYVVLDRALPHIGDGLKPVQRRIVYAMAELGLGPGAKPKKCARTVGDVLGKFHPHGDAACYEALVLMAQPFAFRYPLIDGQGNFGSPDDPKSFAAMRYTEARLSRYARLLLEELEQGTVDWVPNFDGSLEEPAVLPARLPHVLLNGATGIAVGMATDIPPHNLREVAAATVHLLEHPRATVAELCAHLPGPDFPTEAEIVTPPEELRRIYETGSGSLRMRARWEREDGDVVITALPYQVSGAKVLEQIAAQMQARRLPMVEDLRDESDHEHPTRLVIALRSRRADAEALMAHLFATTDLERSYRVNLNVIGLDGRPRVRDLKALLGEWLEFRIRTVRRRLQWRLEKVQARLHVLEGLRVAYLHLDEVIRIVREAEEPQAALMERFGLSEAQAQAILELRLRQLARLEELKILEEQGRLAAEARELEGLLASPRRLRGLIKREIQADAQAYGDERRSPIVARPPARALSEAELLPSEPLTVVLSQRGWVRAAKGHEVDPAGLSYRAGDGLLAAARVRSHQPVAFLDGTGRSYSLVARTLPSARGQGEPLTGRFDPPAGAAFVGLAAGEEEGLWLLASSAGYGFLARLADLLARQKGGKAVLSVPQGATALAPVPVPPGEAPGEVPGEPPEGALVAAASSEGRLLLFPLAELPRLARGRGSRLLALRKGAGGGEGERLAAVAVLPPGGTLLVRAGQRRMALAGADLARYRAERGRRGQLLPRGFRKVQALEVA